MRNDKPTFEAVLAVLQEYGPLIRPALSRLGVRACDLADVEQEVLRAIVRGLPSFDEGLADPAVALRGWIFRLCEQHAANQHRDENRHAELARTIDEIEAAQEGSAPHAEELLIAAQRRAVLHQLLKQIDQRRRAVVIAHTIEGVPMVEVAASQKIPARVAWNRFRLGLEDLRAAGRRMKAKEDPQ